MPGIPDTLRDIHRLRRLARDLQAELDRAPVQLKARRNVLAKAEEAGKQAHEDLKKLKIRTHENEVTFKTTQQQIDKYQRQKGEAADPKQIVAFEHQIATAKAKADALENETLESYSILEEMTAKLPAVDAAAAKAKVDFAAWETQQTERLTRQAGELKDTLAAIKTHEAELPEDVLPSYQRLVNSYGADAFASVDEHNCSHCHTQITQQQLLDVGNGQFVCCARCGRALYATG